VLFIRDLVTGSGGLGFSFQINLWLWFTVLFANFAEAVRRRPRQGASRDVAQGQDRNRRQAAGGRFRTPNGRPFPATQLKRGDVVLVEDG